MALWITDKMSFGYQLITFKYQSDNRQSSDPLTTPSFTIFNHPHYIALRSRLYHQFNHRCRIHRYGTLISQYYQCLAVTAVMVYILELWMITIQQFKFEYMSTFMYIWKLKSCLLMARNSRPCIFFRALKPSYLN